MSTPADSGGTARRPVVPPGSGRAGVSDLERDDRWARVAWSFLVEPMSGPLVRLLAEVGAVEALARLREGRCASTPQLGVRLAALDLDRLAHAVRFLGVRVLVPGDAEWPAGLDRHTHPPYCLYVRGRPDLAALTERSVAVVGSRAATDYGLRVAAELGEGLAARGWAVVSGAAFGIDGAAHRGALAVDGSTVAVLACGVDVDYPRAHRGLIEAVAGAGSVVSEVPVGSRPYRHRFLARNRIIALLARATVVVEASIRSGSLSTAGVARDHHLPVGAVPGPVTSATSAGCHQLLRESDAVLVSDAAEVAELAGRIGEDLAPDPRSAAERAPEDDLDPVAYRVWAALPVRRPATAETLAVDAGVDRAGLVPALAVLELAGLAVRHGDRWRRPPRRRTGGAG
jgi:DNA processing protein